MREGSESLSPDDTEVANSFGLELRKATIEDVAGHVAGETSNDGFTAKIAMIQLLVIG